VRTCATVRHTCTPGDLQFLNELIEAGQVKPVIDRTYPLDAAPDAVR
jgi:NADPH:quinone reductase-like Zn-dependent oxidoreductase